MRLHAGHLLVGTLCTAGLAIAAHAGGIQINEIRIDQNGVDNQEYFELKGPASADLSGYTYLVIGDGSGGSGVIEAVIDLTGQFIAADGHFLVAETTFNDAPDPFGPAAADYVTDLPFENSDNVTHVLVTGFTGANGDDLDTNDDGVLDSTPWSSVVDAIAVVEEANPPSGTEYHYGSLGSEVGPDGTFAPAHVYRCETTGTWLIGRYDFGNTGGAIETPGAMNISCTIPNILCGDLGAGSCFDPNPGPGASPACEDADCCNTICAADPFCCDVDWDDACAQAANASCPGGNVCGTPGAGDCLANNGTPGCEDESCCNAVCLIDPDCCDIAWDTTCVDLAIANCLAPAGPWVINEIHADPQGSVPGDLGGDANGDSVRDTSDDEFVEIYNNTGADQDITGWSITDGIQTRHVFGPTIVKDQCVVVVFGGGTPTGSFGNAVVQIASTGSLSLNNGGDTVSLLDDLSNVMASYTYGGEGGNDQSLTRDPDVVGPFVTHIMAGDPDSGARWSPGTQLDGSNFAGCTALPDMDGDGIPDSLDNCPTIPNFDQADCDGDGEGDACEVDANENGVPDDCEITPPAGLVINEIRIDQVSADNDEYFELRSDNPNESLDQLFYIVIGDGVSAQGSGVIEHVTNLTGSTTDANGFFVAAESTFSLGIANLVTDLNFENSDNVTHMLVANFFGSVGDDLDTDDDGTLDVTPWLAIVDDVAVIRDDDLSGDDDGKGGMTPEDDEHYYSANVVGPEIGAMFNFAPAQVYRCSPDDTWTIGLFDPFDIMSPPTDTPGASNNACTGGGCLGDVTDSAGSGPDGVVDVFDLLEVLGAWGPCVGCPADITDSASSGPDGVVDVFDLLAVLGAWGPCTP